MVSATNDFEAPALEPANIFWIWARHLTSLSIPVITLGYLVTGPHKWWVAPFFLIPMGYLYFLDMRTKVEVRQPLDDLPAWPFDAIVYALAILQLAIVYQMAVMFSTQAIFSVDMAMVFLLVGGNSGFSIITAHELIHRTNRWEQQLGRLLLCTVLYEHFYTEHLRGHHVRVGTADDPATARFGETYREFWRRTVPAQFKSAWKLEARRLGDEDMSLFDSRMWRNRILHGIAVGWGIGIAIYLGFGLAAFVAYVLQAFFAVRLLEAVNYFEHWGLVRRTRRVRPIDSWDTHSWFTYYGLTGLSRHADHHAYPARPFQQLRVWEDAPILPHGYVGMVDMVLVKNDEFREQATAELKRRRLGPFAEDAEPGEAEAALAPQNEAEQMPPIVPVAVGRLLGNLPKWLRGALVAGIFLLAVSFGASIEGSAPAGVWGTFVQNAWIFGVFAAGLYTHYVLQQRGRPEALAWGAAFALLLVAGRLTDFLLV